MKRSSPVSLVHAAVMYIVWQSLPSDMNAEYFGT